MIFSFDVFLPSYFLYLSLYEYIDLCIQIYRSIFSGKRDNSWFSAGFFLPRLCRVFVLFSFYFSIHDKKNNTKVGQKNLNTFMFKWIVQWCDVTYVHTYRHIYTHAHINLHMFCNPVVSNGSQCIFVSLFIFMINQKSLAHIHK